VILMHVLRSYLRAQYGTYKADGNSWKRGEELGNVYNNPKYPDFEFEPFNMRTCNWKPKDFAKVTGLLRGLLKLLKIMEDITVLGI